MTIQPNVEQALRDVVTRYLNASEAFTSVDVVTNVREQGYFLKHAAGAEWLRRNVIQMSYERAALYNQTLIEVNSKREGLTRAYLYHHMNFDPDLYGSRGEAQNTDPLIAAMASIGIDAYQSRNYRVPAPSVDRRIEMRRLDGSKVAAFDTIEKAARFASVDASNIAKVARGERNTAGGYRWVYV